MNTTYHISYDLKKPGRDYNRLYQAIKGLGAWCHPVESTWYVNTEYDATSIRDTLTATMDENDKVLVTKASAPGAWKGLSKEVSDWLLKHL